MKSTKLRRGLLVAVLGMHIAGMVANFDAMLFGREPTALGAVSTVIYVLTWIAFSAVLGATGGRRAVWLLALYWVAVVAISFLSFEGMNSFEGTATQGGLFAPLLFSALATPFYGITGALAKGSGSFVAYIAAVATLGLVCVVTLVVSGLRSRVH
ncbi:MAG: hypothetical protein ACOH1Y_03865 [Propionicimonas sp.]